MMIPILSITGISIVLLILLETRKNFLKIQAKRQVKESRIPFSRSDFKQLRKELLNHFEAVEKMMAEIEHDSNTV